MIKTNGPVDPNKAKSQQRVVYKGKPGTRNKHCQSNMGLRCGKLASGISQVSSFVGPFFGRPWIRMQMQTFPNNYSRCPPYLSSPFIKGFQCFQLNLFVNSNEVSFCNLSNPKKYVYQTYLNILNGIEFINVINLPINLWNCAARSWIFLANLNRPAVVVDLSVFVVPEKISRVVENDQTWASPCRCGPAPRWTGAGGWRSTRCRSFWRRRSLAGCSTHWWTWSSTRA